MGKDQAFRRCQQAVRGLAVLGQSVVQWSSTCSHVLAAACLCAVDSMNMGSLRQELMMPPSHMQNLLEDEDEDELDTEMMIMGQTPGSFIKKPSPLAGVCDACVHMM